MADKKINVAVIGLGFGAEFIPIYQKHPNANIMAICQRNEKRLNEIDGNHFFRSISKVNFNLVAYRYGSYLSLINVEFNTYRTSVYDFHQRLSLRNVAAFA